MTEFSLESTHFTVCSCPSCSAEFISQENESTAYNYIFDAENGQIISAQGLVMPNSEPGYIQSLFGEDSALWASGGAGTAAFGTAQSAIYTFQDVAWGNPYGWGNESAYDGAQTAAAMAAMDMWSNVSNFTFVAGNAANAQIAFREYNLPAGAGVAVSWTVDDDGGGNDRIVQVEVSPDDSLVGFAKGDYGWVTFMHEVGHAIGVKHPGDYNAGGGGADGPFLVDFGLIDSRDFTVMSYNAGVYTGGGNNPTGLMLYDIAIAQYLYGVDNTYNSGNTTYNLASDGEILARWDGGGTDTLNASSYGSGATLDLREGESYVTHVGTSHTWNAFGANIENATGGAGNDVLYGNDLDNVLIGNAGNDDFDGGAGNDTLNGGAGANDYSFDNNDGTNVIIDSDGSGTITVGGKQVTGAATDAGGGTYTLTITGTLFSFVWAGVNLAMTTAAGSTALTINSFVDGWFGITLPGGGGGGNTIDGTISADRMVDTAAADVVNGLDGNDMLKSYDGADTLNGGNHNDTLYAFSAGGELNGDGGNDSLYLRDSGITANGGDGNDRIYGNASATNATMDGGDGVDVISADGTGSIADGGAGNDTLYSRGSNVTLNGGDDDDYMTGYVSGQVLNGDAGNDRITNETAGNTLSGGDGNDTILGGGVGTEIYGDAGNDLITVKYANAYADGGANDDTIKVKTSNVTVDGGDGDDYIEAYGASGVVDGGAGNDLIRANSGNDTLSGGADNDSVYAGSGNDIVNGNDGNDFLDGQNGSDVIDGGAGNDTLHGGRNDDTLTGGAGSDIFQFDRYGGTDTITDFEIGTDMLQHLAYNSVSDTTLYNQMSQVGADVEVTYGRVTIVLENITLTDLDGVDFIV